MKWILITGGTGFIGTNLCKKLLDENNYVIAIDNHITSPKNHQQLFSNHPHYQFLYHDIVDTLPEQLLPKHISIQTIYHLACPTGVPNLVPLAEEMILTCSQGTKHILELSLAHNADVVFASSSEVYGDPQVSPQTEEYAGNVSTVGIRGPYEEGKRFSETLVMMYVRKYNLRAKIIRIFNTYGPYMSLDDTRVIPRFIHQLKLQKPLTIQGDGNHTRTFCFVDDLIAGMRTVQKKGENGEVYNVGSTEEISIYELAKVILQLCKNNKGIQHIPQFSVDHSQRKPSLEKIYQLGWHVQTPLRKGLQKTLQWYGL